MPKEKKKVNLAGIVALVLIAAFLGTYLVSILGHKKLHKPDDTPHPVTNTNNSGPYEPPFIKHGELTFLSGTDRRPIRRIAVEIADTEVKRNQGLMYRKSMADTNGMLFLFPYSEPRNFWMHETYIPLDIIYVDENRKIVSIARNSKPLSDDNIPSGKSAQFVVEVNAGFCDKHGIKEGDVVSF